MKLLYVHDHKLRINKDDYFTTGGFSDEVTTRYTSVFGEMTLLCRAIENYNVNGCTKINNKHVSIVADKSNRKCSLKKITSLVRDSEVVMIRLPSIFGIYAAFACFLLKRRYCVEVVGSALGSYWHKSILGKIVAYPLEVINKVVIKKASHVLYVSEDYLQKEYPTKGKNCGCSDVIITKTTEDEFEKRIKKINECNEKSIVLGTLGQIDFKYKGHKTVIKAISKLKEDEYSIKYRLAGSGSPSYIKSICESHDVSKSIIFDGQIEHKNIDNWIDEIDVYVQPSLTEGIPRSVIEVINRGCPVIVSDAGGMYELIDSEFTFKKNDEEGLCRLLKSLNSEVLKNMAVRNYRFAEKFDYDSLARKRNAFYQEVREDYSV